MKIETAQACKVELRRLYDLHCHFRTDDMLARVLKHTAKYAKYGIAMPNTKPPILRGTDATQYESEILGVRNKIPMGPLFEPLMTIEIRDSTTPNIVRDAHDVNVVAGKIYPAGVTTNSQDGFRDFYDPRNWDVFEEMQSLHMLLLIHPQQDRDRLLVTDRERKFMETIFFLAGKFPELKIVVEHISTKEGIETVLELGPNVAGTITGHHLYLTLNDVISSSINVHNACQPIPNSFEDRDAIRKAALSGNPKFYLGSDTAPHPRENKEHAHGSCGVFSAPVLPQVLTQFFAEAGELEKLEDFTSTFGADFYGLPLCDDTITLVKEPWTVPDEYDGIVPFMAGQKLEWQLAS